MTQSFTILPLQIVKTGKEIQGHLSRADTVLLSLNLYFGLLVWRTLSLLTTPPFCKNNELDQGLCFLGFSSLQSTGPSRGLEEVTGWVPQGAENSKIGRRQGASIALALQDTPLTLSPRAPWLVHIWKWLHSHLLQQGQPGPADHIIKGNWVIIWSWKGGNYCYKAAVQSTVPIDSRKVWIIIYPNINSLV